MRVSKLFLFRRMRSKRERIGNGRIRRRRREMEIGPGEGALSGLPEDIVIKIQARLPLVSLVRSRGVCRAWKAAVDSPRCLLQERLEWRAGAGAREHMLLVAGFRLGESEGASGPAMALLSCAYDPASDRWYELQLGLGLRWYELQLGLRLPPPPGLGLAQEEEEETSFVELAPASMSAGVLLARWCPDPGRREGEKVLLHIGNPVAGSWASLPALPDGLGMRHVCGVLVDAVARRFNVVVVGDTHLHRFPFLVPMVIVGTPTFVFDSALGMWNVTSRVLPPGDKFHAEAGEGVFVGTVLYCLTDSCNLLAYDLEGASWSLLLVDKKAVSLINIYYSRFRLFSVRDRLLCAAFDRDDRMRDRLQIWEMDLAATAWNVVASMPAPMGIEFLSPPFLCSVVSGQEEVYIMRERLDKVKIVAVDFRHTPPAWRWLPSLPYKGFTRRSLHCFDPWLQFGSWEQD